MHRDDADALNRALDEIAMGEPPTGSDVDPALLATFRWFDDLGRRTAPDPVFVERLERALLNDGASERSATGTSAVIGPARRGWMRGRSNRGIPVPRHLPRSGWASGAVVWGSWVVILALVALAVIGALQILPGGSDDDVPALAPGFPIDEDIRAELASHPLVGAWRLDPDPGVPTRVVFHADGTYVEIDPLQGTGIGMWRPTGQRSAEVIVEWPNRNAPGRLEEDAGATGGIGDPVGREVEYMDGSTTMRSTFTASEDGTSFSGTYHLQQFLPGGELVPVEPEGTFTGTRLGFDAPAATASVDQATHSIVGAWTLQPAVGPPSMAAFHADGTYIEINPLQGTGVGVWRATDAGSGEVLVEWPNRNESGRRQAATLPEGYLQGWATLESTFTLGGDGTTFAGTYEMQRFYPNGVGFHADHAAGISGTRIVTDSLDAAEGDVATHPLVGVWVQDPAPLAQGAKVRQVFHTDGTYLSATSCCGSGIGVWQPTNERSAELIVQVPNRNPPMGGYVEGTSVLREVLTVAESGSTVSGLLHAQYFFPNGVQMVDEPRAEIQATRFTSESPASTPAP